MGEGGVINLYFQVLIGQPVVTIIYMYTIIVYPFSGMHLQ